MPHRPRPALPLKALRIIGAAALTLLGCDGAVTRLVPDAGHRLDAAIDGGHDGGHDGGRADAGPMADAGPPLGVDCDDAGYSGWRCWSASYPRPGGELMEVAIRYNLPDESVEGSVIWVLGSGGGGSFRNSYRGATPQDAGADASIRSVEIEFLGAEGYWTHPMGHVENGRLLNIIVRDLRARQVLMGRWITYVGLSNGATIGAAALAHYRLDDVVSRFVFLSGPFLSSARASCTSPLSAEYLDTPESRGVLDTWNGWQSEAYCENGSATAPYEERSVLVGENVRTDYPDVQIHVIMGADDDLAPWILRANAHWYRQVSALEKTRHVLEGVGHETSGGPGVADSEALAYSLSLIERFALSTPETVPTPMPTLIYAATAGGPPITRAARASTVYGRVENIDVDRALGCAEVVELAGVPSATAAGGCGSPDAFTPPGAESWSASADAADTLTWMFVADAIAEPGIFLNMWRDGATQAHSEIVEVEIY